MAETRRPIHLGIAVGVSASLYAVSLAAVTGLQSAQNAQIDRTRTPRSRTRSTGSTAPNADLEARLEAARAAFDASATAFSDVAGQVPGFETRLKSPGRHGHARSRARRSRSRRAARSRAFEPGPEPVGGQAAGPHDDVGLRSLTAIGR